MILFLNKFVKIFLDLTLPKVQSLMTSQLDLLEMGQLLLKNTPSITSGTVPDDMKVARINSLYKKVVKLMVELQTC